MQLEAYTKQWIDNLKDQNKQFHLSRKELIQIGRFKGQVNLQKQVLYTVDIPGKNQKQQVLKSDFSPEDSQYPIALVQMKSSEPLEVFDQHLIESLFSSEFHLDQEFDMSLQAPKAGQESSIVTTINVNLQTEIDVMIHKKIFESDTDGLFVLFIVSEIDIKSKKTTGRYAIIKLSSDAP